jgi:tripartite-type tricarboxylate transporter receptor subunit TctC
MGTVGTHGINKSLYARLAYDPQKDFAPITLVAGVPNVMVMNTERARQLGIQHVPDFIAYARSHPAAFNMASSGNGTSIHLAGEVVQIHDGCVHDAHPLHRLGAGAAGSAVGPGRRDV